MSWIAVMIWLLTLAQPIPAEQIRVAVASNFSQVAKRLAEEFELGSGHRVKLILGSTGKHFAQIRHGAPFDVFLAADSRRPTLLESEGLAIEGSRFTYALGRLALWSSRPGFVDSGGHVLRQGEFVHLAIANPRLAPYGYAAQQALSNLGLWEDLQDRIVRGENIGQTFQFVHSGNAELGFVALSQVRNHGTAAPGSSWEIPGHLHEEIEQQAVLLRSSSSARSFLKFMKSPSAKKWIRQAGYDLPAGEDP